VNLSVVIPALDAEATLAATVASLDGADEIVVVDGGSADNTVKLAESLGARVLQTPKSRGAQLSAGAEAASAEWLLFVHADTRLQRGWREAVNEFIAGADSKTKAAAFNFGLDDESFQARRLEKIVRWRVHALGLPYGDQGLLIHRDFYRQLGGFRSMPIMEDVDLALRIGRKRFVTLPVTTRTSARRWREKGWLLRSAYNLFCLSLYFLGVPPRFIARFYG
jgi:rSAM/selenodomain-associated transferase 2